VHPRISVSGLCFPQLSAVDALAAVAGLGAANASLTGAKVRESGAGAVAAASLRHGVKIVTTTGALGLDLSSGQASGPSLRRAREDIDLAAAVGATVMYGLVGPRTSARWDASADAYVNAVGELVGYAADRGLTLAIEPTSWLYADLTFIHSFHDAILVAPRAGLGICLDAFHVWTEARLCEDISEHVGLIAHVQLSDMVPGSRTAVPGRPRRRGRAAGGHRPVAARRRLRRGIRLRAQRPRHRRHRPPCGRGADREVARRAAEGARCLTGHHRIVDYLVIRFYSSFDRAPWHRRCWRSHV
jgi:sugar phosphate isomerase/epimerase